MLVLIESYPLKFVSVCSKQHNIPELIQNETIYYIRSDPHGLRSDNECGKLQVITGFIEICFF